MRKRAVWQRRWLGCDMARSRNIKPGFFKNETLAECSPLARLLFAGLWCLADRADRLEDRPKRIRAEVLPYDDGSVDEMLDELHQAGFILRYQVGEQRFIQVRNFCRHQNPHHREAESTIPEPGNDDAMTVQDQGKPRACLGLSSDKPETSRADSLNLIPDSLNPLPEKNPCSPSASVSADDGFAEFWNRYPKKVAKTQAMKAWQRIKSTDRPLADLMSGLERQKVSEQWQKSGGKFIPHPATWLNGRRWEDEPAGSSTGQPTALSRQPQPGDSRTRFGAAEVFTENLGWVPA